MLVISKVAKQVIVLVTNDNLKVLRYNQMVILILFLVIITTFSLLYDRNDY
jgi:hypothetical protein